MSQSAFLLVILALAESDSRSKYARIVGGRDATDVPWIVPFIHHKTGSVYGNQFCAGTIINESWVLTAAHCTINREPSRFYIWAGVVDLRDTSSGQSRDILTIHSHEDYNSRTLVNDISVIELESPLELNDDVVAIDIANVGNPEDTGQEYSIAGWGSLDKAGKKFPHVLQELEGVPHYDIRACKQRLTDISLTTHICAGGNTGYDACTGDSGGPMWLYVNSTPMLYGITSWGRGCATTAPGVYTRVSAYREWIESKIGTNLSNPYNGTLDIDSCECPSLKSYCDCPDDDGLVFNNWLYDSLQIAIPVVIGMLVLSGGWILISQFLRWRRLAPTVTKEITMVAHV